MPSYSGVWNLVSQYQAQGAGLWPANYVAPIGLFAGGYTGSYLNVIDYIQFETTGNAADFGDLTTGSGYNGGAASSTRGLFFQTPPNYSTINYVTFATAGNAVNFGNITYSSPQGGTCVGYSNSTRALFIGWRYTGSAYIAENYYVTIATTGDAALFGTLSVSRVRGCGFASTTRGVVAGGAISSGDTQQGSPINVIDYVTIATAGSATDFGDLTNTIYYTSGCSSSTRGLIGGGSNDVVSVNVIQYVTIASTGNATDFGDLVAAIQALASCSSSTRGVFAGGESPTSNVIEYVTIASTGNSTDFGDLTVGRYNLSACSNSHGGL